MLVDPFYYLFGLIVHMSVVEECLSVESCFIQYFCSIHPCPKILCCYWTYPDAQEYG